jgi:putative heme iron utilization protein
MATNVVDLESTAEDFRVFARQFQSLQLATASAEGTPEASYAPFYKDGRDFYVYVSELSRHTANLAENPRASVLFIENERDASHLFARRRLTYQCHCEEIPRGTGPFERTMDAIEGHFGRFIGMLRKLDDFHLYRVTPLTGTYVAGFARAFELVGDELDQVRHINDVGHRPKDAKTEQETDDTAEQQAADA